MFYKKRWQWGYPIPSTDEVCKPPEGDAPVAGDNTLQRRCFKEHQQGRQNVNILQQGFIKRYR